MKKVPEYLKHGSFILVHNTTVKETAEAFHVTEKQIRDNINHGLKTNYPKMFNHVKSILGEA